MLPMYSSVENIVGRGWEAARPGRCGPGRTVEAAERGSVYCGGGCWAGGGWSLYWPRHRHCPASLLCRQWPGCAPGAPHRPAPPHTARTSIVSGDGRLPPTYTTLPSHPGLHTLYSPSCGDQADLNPAAEPLSGQGAVQRGGGARPGPASVLLSQRRRGAGTESSTVATLLQ